MNEELTKEETERRENLIPTIGIPAAKSSNRVWFLPDGSKVPAGGQFKDGEQVPLQETDLDRMRR